MSKYTIVDTMNKQIEEKDKTIAALKETIALLDSQLANERMRCYNLERMLIRDPNPKTIED
tara:strand:+ start:6768 stop:6950 length:183 start_codon:yes stop_codon:yes gene_type:complete